MRIVDDETRKLVMQNRIDALEGDNLFESNFLTEDPDGDKDSDDHGEGGAKARDGGYTAEYVVEEAEESEEISDDAEAGESKVKTKRKEKTK